MIGPRRDRRTARGDPSRRRFLGALAALTTAGLAGCSSGDGGDGDPEAGDDDPAAETPTTTPTPTPTEEPPTPSAEEFEPVVRAWVEATTEGEREELLHPESTLVAAVGQDEWELSRIKDVRWMSDEEVVIPYSAQRESDGIYSERHITLRLHEGEWLVYATN